MNHIALSRNDFNTLDPIHIETGLGLRRNSRMPNAITRPERPRLNRLESGLPILWKGGDEWNCHGTGRG